MQHIAAKGSPSSRFTSVRFVFLSVALGPTTPPLYPFQFHPFGLSLALHLTFLQETRLLGPTIETWTGTVCCASLSSRVSSPKPSHRHCNNTLERLTTRHMSVTRV
jgi:hypothetical protein